MDDDERASFVAWVRASQSHLLQSTYLMTGDPHLAQDLLQDAFVKVAARWEKLQHENPDGYIRRILYRDHVSWWRRRREFARESVREVAEEDSSGASVDSLVLGQALSRLTSKQRAVLVLRFFDDLTEQQTADTLGVSVGTVKSQSSAAMARLRRVAPELAAFQKGGDPDVE